MSNNYKQLLTALIKKQMIILGPAVALSKARKVKELMIADDGTVTEIKGDEKAAFDATVEEFISFSGAITKNIVDSLVESDH